jgi:predicted adenylyl cyclase CyaB
VNVNAAASHQPEPRQNVELKARIASIESLREIAGRLATESLETQEQVDTYFCCDQGRLKLREIRGQTSQLIGYQRPDEEGMRTSHYTIVPIDHPRELIACLETVLGIRAVVRKVREIFLYQNVRIHLDRVDRLGTFLEFEAVLDPGIDARVGQEQVAWLSEQFHIAPEDIVAGSYIDLLEVTS